MCRARKRRPWIGRILPRMGALLTVLLLGACGGGSNVRSDAVKEPREAVAPAADTAIAASVAPVEAALAPGQSGFRLLTLNTNALLQPAGAGRQGRSSSIDLQYYISENDDTGRLVAQRLLKRRRPRRARAPAGRRHHQGRGRARCSRRSTRTSNIEVRRVQSLQHAQPGALSRAAQMLMEFRRLNRRMHNKSFIVDNRSRSSAAATSPTTTSTPATSTTTATSTCWRSGRWCRQASQASTATGTTRRRCRPRPGQRRRTAGRPREGARRVGKRRARVRRVRLRAGGAARTCPTGPPPTAPGDWFWGAAMLVADQPEKIEAAARRRRRACASRPQVKELHVRREVGRCC